MIIDGWWVDGFGCLHDHEVAGLGTGVTVVVGANEAGKSTLLGFLRAVLFGFADRRTGEKLYEPLRGGRHGGRLRLRDGAGGVWTLERFADGARKTVALRAPDGREAGDEELRRLLGNVDAGLFKSVFAFSLSELQDLRSLDDQGVRDRIFSAGVTGAGKSARDVIKRFDQRAAELLKQGRGQAVINDLVRDINAKRAEVSEAERAAGGYGGLLKEEGALDLQLHELESQTEPLQTRRRRLEALVEMHPQWLKLRELGAELAALPKVADESLPDRVAGLVESLTGQRAREERVTVLAADEARARDDLAVHLGRLGTGWTVERVRAFDDSVAVRDEAREWRERLEAAEGESDAAARERDAAAGRVAALQHERDGVAAEVPEQEPRPADAIDADVRRLSGLQSDVQELQQQRLIEQSTRPPVAPGARVGLVAAVLAGAGAAVASALGYGQLAVGLLVAAVLLGVVAALGSASRGGRAARGPRAGGEGAPGARSASSAADDLAVRVAAAAATFGLPPVPARADLEGVQAGLDGERRARGEWDAASVRLRDAERRLSSEAATAARLVEAATRAAAERDSLSDGWDAQLAERGLSELSPAGFIDLVGVIGEARAADAVVRNADRELAGIEAEARRWDEAAADALVSAGRAHVSHDRETLRAALLGLHGDLQRRLVVLADIRRGEESLTARFGADETAAESRAELASGTVVAWQEEESRLADQAARVKEEREAILEERARVRQRREEIERSADVAQLQNELESLRAELAVRVREYRELVTARELVAGTLQTFVRERQPAVLSRASEAFARVTDGRYTSVEQDEAGDESVVVVSADARLTPEQLSRGTAEQLYLTIRLALAHEFARRSEPLPLVMDDCLVNFDPRRAAQVARLLVESARDGQCLLFTCHPETVELVLEQSGGAARVIELASSA